MPRAQRYTLAFAPEVVQDLGAIDRKFHAILRKRIHQSLVVEPDRETRNRKPLDVPAPYGSQWELRFGPSNRYRVFYEIERDAAIVTILAIGVKERDVLRIGREEYNR